MKPQTLMTGTLLLTISSLLVRTVSMISMIYLSQILGTAGIGTYELMTSLYMTAIVFASAGLSTSVSKLVAEELCQNGEGNIRRILQITFSMAITTGIVMGTILFLFAPQLTLYFIHNTQTLYALRFLSLSIPFIACSSCFKGYFYATRKTLYPASADILEQLVKLGLIIILTRYYAPFGLSYTFQGAAMGLTFGEIFSWSYLLCLFSFDTREKRTISSKASLSVHTLLARLLHILVPIALIAYMSYIFLSVENLIIPLGFKKYGESLSSSMSLYGMLKGMVLPILFFPSAFLTAFSTTLIPEVAYANVHHLKDRVQCTTSRVLQLTFILSFLVVGIFLSYGNELGFVLYKSEAIGPMIRLLTLVVPFIYTEVIADGILKGLGEQVSCLKYSLIDAIIRIILLYLILPFKGIYGLIGITMASCIFTSLLNFNKLLCITQVTPQFANWLLKPTIAAAFASSYSRLIINKFFRYSLGLTSKVILGIVLIIFMYIPLLFIVQTITEQDLHWLKKQLHLLRIKKPSSLRKTIP